MMDWVRRQDGSAWAASMNEIHPIVRARHRLNAAKEAWNGYCASTKAPARELQRMQWIVPATRHYQRTTRDTILWMQALLVDTAFRSHPLDIACNLNDLLLGLLDLANRNRIDLATLVNMEPPEERRRHAWDVWQDALKALAKHQEAALKENAMDKELKSDNERITAQPAPVQNNKPAVWDLVIKDMADRDKAGREKYGTPLQPHNGRDALTDAYQEALDLAVYLRQSIYERDGR